MPRRWYHMSLARRISLLFGSALLLVITVTLWSPSLQMNAQHQQAMLLLAQRVAGAALLSVDLQQPDWWAEQQALERRWPELVRTLDLPRDPPALVPTGSQAIGPHGFRAGAIAQLQDQPSQTHYWQTQDDGRVFRYAMAIRGKDTDTHPTKLRGIIDVRLPKSDDIGVWNLVVMVLAGASGAVLAMFVFFVVTQRLVLSPVTVLREAAERVATGDIEARSVITTGDEFQKLSDTFNEMLTHLHAAQESQRKINRSLDVKLGELAETNVALYESNRLKTEFLANVTHELRTPLVSIIGFAELLRDAWDSPNIDRQRVTRYSQNILTSGRNLLDIINDLLDLAKTEAGKMQLHLSQFSITELCKDLIDFVQPLADKREQQLDLIVDAEPAPMTSDAGKIKQILYNLLSNAVKFTPPHGTISLRVADTVDGVRLIVRDTGPGISEALIDQVFEKFRQLDSSETREYAGTGLGLAITKELVHMLRGTVSLESKPGDGATFVVELPSRISQDVPARPISLIP